MNNLNGAKGHKVVTPGGLDADNDGKPVSIRGLGK